MSRWAKQIQMQLKIPAIGVSSVNVIHYGLDYDFKYSNGMPIRYVAVPFPFTGQPKAVDVGYVAGKDQLSGQPLMTSVIKALTGPLTAEEDFRRTGRPSRRYRAASSRHRRELAADFRR